MAFRITSLQTTASLIDQINRNKVDLENTRQEIASGLTVSNPSDDPGRAATLITLQSTIQRLKRHQERVGSTTDYLAAQEGAVNSAQDAMIRLNELAEQAASGNFSFEQRAQIADEVFQLRDSLASVANTQYQGKYIFGGLDEDDAPVDYVANYFDQPPTAAAPFPPEKGHYVFDDPATEPGQDQTRNVDISDTDNIRINTPAATIFERAINAATQLGRAMEGYETFRNGTGDLIATGNPPQLNLPTAFATQTGQILEGLDMLRLARTDDVEVELSSIGARTNRLQQTDQLLTTLITSADQSRGNIQDTDVFAAASTFAQVQTSLQALLASGSQINNLSLLDFL